MSQKRFKMSLRGQETNTNGPVLDLEGCKEAESCYRVGAGLSRASEALKPSFDELLIQNVPKTIQNVSQRPGNVHKRSRVGFGEMWGGEMLLPGRCGPLPRFWNSKIKIWRFCIQNVPLWYSNRYIKKSHYRIQKKIYSFLVLVFFQQNLLTRAKTYREPSRNLDSKRGYFEPAFKMFTLRTQPTDLGHQRFLHQSREQAMNFSKHSKFLSELL